MFEHDFTTGLLNWQTTLQYALPVMLIGLLVLAIVLFAAARVHHPLAQAIAGRSLRTTLLASTMFVGILPALATAVILAERSASARYAQIASRLSDTAEVAAAEVDLFIDKHVAAVASAARVISSQDDRSDRAMFNWLSLYHDIYDDFLTMMVTDGRGDIRAATIILNEQPAGVGQLEGQNVSDRPYFREPMRDGQTFVSDVFRGRGLGNDPIVAVSAVITDASGSRTGIVEGSLNLRRFSRVENNTAMIDESILLIIDEQSRIIYATDGSGFPILSSVADDAARIGLNPAAERNGDTVFETPDFVAAHAYSDNGWQVVLRVPSSVIQQQTSSDYGLAAALVLAAMGIAVLLGLLVARRIVRALKVLNASIDTFTLDGNGEDFVIPNTTPAEFQPVLAHMRRRSKKLRDSHEKLTKSLSEGAQLSDQLAQVISDKEDEIARRTHELQEANERLEDLSRRDELTGIANRRGYDLFDERVRALCRRASDPLTTVMIDIDFFKQYNDLYGHDAGDKCLRQVAQALASCAKRPLDLVARFGGEEFIVVLGATRIASGVIVAERMREAVRELAITHAGSVHGIVTVSIGVAGLAPGEEAADGQSRIEADRALYVAKSSGRDSVFYAIGSTASRYDPQASISDTAIHNVRQLQSG